MSLAVKTAMENAPPPHAISYISMIWMGLGNTRNALAVVGTMEIIPTGLRTWPASVKHGSYGSSLDKAPVMANLPNERCHGTIFMHVLQIPLVNWCTSTLLGQLTGATCGIACRAT